mmetsp:Transcript_7429/g.16238  ORF Transcript_7429/g.16238 Transcript_7429/m.16238 type:complete len:151 (+) Transcript_7429:272-724(+)|eukprot:CAMPEP_0178492884 /NCGR_PEP_ID=MMETSP0696-20121128/12175_1 /TAXON_ID=265572 /ORGANISM="Extubocellulus spinifer, Strain CCMP396" /LENGTH=150 /DNA_ID=CAMNT_0020120837 /DNA_START=317 /DNA_END=769 /DNA_ORIENTATION=+
MTDQFGSGTPGWGRGGSRPQQRGSGEFRNRYEGQSYQNSGASGYNPPSYADQQTQHVEDAMKTHYEAEGTAAAVMSQMTTQRHQLQRAHDDVAGTRMKGEQAKRELDDLINKVRRKKRRLYAIIAMLGAVDALLFLRILQCGGSFFCGWH